MLALNARRRVIGNIKDRQYFPIVADEATDISKVEQMSITIRTCTKDYQIQEHVIGIRECKEGVSAKALFDMIKDTMTRCMLDKETF